MPEKRRHSRDYLTAAFQRDPRTIEVWRQFHAFALMLIAKMRVGIGKKVELVCEGEDLERNQILFAEDPLLLGTFHVGASDLLGFHISSTGRRVLMIRMRVANSGDLTALARTYGKNVRFVWVNDAEQLLFSLRDALQTTSTVALQCDRTEGAERGEAFHFLGCQRLFRISIYRLARIFERKVLFCVAVPEVGFERFRILAYEIFDGRGLNPEQHRQAAHQHFQGVLIWLEAILRENPYIWFNFVPLNPPQPTFAEDHAPLRFQVQPQSQ